MPTFPILIQHILRIFSKKNETGTRNKIHINKKGRSQTIPICRRHDLVVKIHEKLHQNLLDIINTFSKVAGYKKSLYKTQ
jgi:hypothetical protein